MFFSQSRIIKAIVIVAFLMFLVPFVLRQPVVARLGKMGAFAANVAGVLGALWLVAQFRLGGAKS